MMKIMKKQLREIALKIMSPNLFNIFIVQFQKISTPTPWKVNGNSKGMGGLKGQNFKRKLWSSSGNSRGVGQF